MNNAIIPSMNTSSVEQMCDYCLPFLTPKNSFSIERNSSLFMKTFELIHYLLGGSLDKTYSSFEQDNELWEMCSCSSYYQRKLFQASSAKLSTLQYIYHFQCHLTVSSIVLRLWFPRLCLHRVLSFSRLFSVCFTARAVILKIHSVPVLYRSPKNPFSEWRIELGLRGFSK